MRRAFRYSDGNDYIMRVELVSRLHCIASPKYPTRNSTSSQRLHVLFWTCITVTSAGIFLGPDSAHLRGGAFHASTYRLGSTLKASSPASMSSANNR